VEGDPIVQVQDILPPRTAEELVAGQVFLNLPCDSYGLLSNPPDSNIVFNNLPPNSFCLTLVFTGHWWWDQKITNLGNKIGKLSPDAPEENKLYMQARLARLCAFRLAFGFASSFRPPCV